MGIGEIVTSIVAALVAIGAVAMIVDARRKRRKAAAEQRHSNIKPLSNFDSAELIQKGGLGGNEGGGV